MNIAVNVVADRKQFDEQAYLRLYPDIAEAVAKGGLPSAWIHYFEHGAAEGRKPNDFDEAFYLETYSEARRALAQGRVASAIEHYLQFGRGCGFRPNSKAPRLPSAGGQASRFGGLWIDQSHAASLIESKLDIGRINGKQAQQLRFFCEHGYLVLPRVIPANALERTRAEVQKSFAGGFPKLGFDIAAPDQKPVAWRADLAASSASALDLHYLSAPLRDLVFDENITKFLELIFESKCLLSQTQSFARLAARAPRQESGYLAHSLPRQFAAAWVALEDAAAGSGELFLYPGSHRLPDLVFGGRFKTLSEARRAGMSEEDAQTAITENAKQVENRARANGFRKQVFGANAGDVVVLHADLINGSVGSPAKLARKTVLAHYCPSFVMPLIGEARNAKPEMIAHQTHFWLNTRRV